MVIFALFSLAGSAMRRSANGTSFLEVRRLGAFGAQEDQQTLLTDSPDTIWSKVQSHPGRHVSAYNRHQCRSDKNFSALVNPTWHNAFGEVYVASLPRNKEKRLTVALQTLSDLHVPKQKIRVYAAIDGKEWGKPPFNHRLEKMLGLKSAKEVLGLPKFECEPAIRGECCCALTHAGVMHSVATGTADAVLVVEDDICPTTWLASESQPGGLLHRLPKSWGLLKFEDCHRTGNTANWRVKGPTKSQVNAWLKYDIVGNQDTYCSAAYAVTKKFAQKFMKAFPKLQDTNCDDQLIEFVKRDKMEFFLLAHNFFIQDHVRFKSDIETSDGLSEGAPNFMLGSRAFNRQAKETKVVMVKKVVGNAMCDLYPHEEGVEFPYTSPLQELKCFEAYSEDECRQKCSNHAHDGTLDQECTAYIWHPSPGPVVMCDETDLKNVEAAAWAKKCCLRYDGLFPLFIPMPGAEPENPSEAVVSGSFVNWEAATDEEKGQAEADIEADEEDEQLPKRSSWYQNSHNMNVLYELFGNDWTVAREECLSAGMDLCPLKNLCSSEGAKQYSAFSKSVDHGKKKKKKKEGVTFLPSTPWVPTLEVCDGFVNAKTLKEKCEVSWTPEKAIERTTKAYWRGDGSRATGEGKSTLFGGRGRYPLPCCERSGHYDNREHWTSAHTEKIIKKLDDKHILDLKQPGAVNILRIIIHHSTAGFFAAVSWVLSQILLANKYGLVPWVEWGPCVTSGWPKSGRNFRYFDANQGSNAWAFFFEQIQSKTKLPVDENYSPPLNVLTLSNTQAWKIRVHPEFSCEQYSEICGSYGVGSASGISGWYAEQRTHAFEAMKQVTVRKAISDEADAFWAKNTKGVPAVICAHVRGTDKDPEIGGYKVPPAKYFPFIDEFLKERPGSKVFIATDSPKYLTLLKNKYGSKMFYYDGMDDLRKEGNSFLDASTSNKGYYKGLAVMLDAILLSKGEALLGSNSAVAEFAVYFNPLLAQNRSFNLQFKFLPVFAKAQKVFENTKVLTDYKPPTGPECGET